MIEHLRLSLVTHHNRVPSREYPRFLRTAVRGGITSVQFREKNSSEQDLLKQALKVQAVLKPFKIPLIVNDHLDLAHKINAEGVHLGQQDFSPITARKILGPNKIIGWTIETLDQLEEANKLQCINYVGASAIFFSKTKPDCKTLWGLEGLQQLSKNSRHPIIAIGGINLTNIADVIASGASGVAVIGAIHDSPDAYLAAKELAEKVEIAVQRRSYGNKY